MVKELKDFAWDCVVNPHMDGCVPIVIVEASLEKRQEMCIKMVRRCWIRHISIIFVGNELRAVSSNISLIELTGRGFELKFNLADPQWNGDMDKMLSCLFDN